MKTTLHSAQSGDLRRAGGFTLVELLTVIAIIVLLVGITIGILGYAQSAAAAKKAEGQMELIITGLRLYENEYGEFPEPVDNSGKGTGGAKALYQALSGDGDNYLIIGAGEGTGASTGKPGTSGTAFVEGLDPNANKHGLVAKGSGSYHLADPFAQPWHYRKFVKNEPGEPTHNKTYDLWSIGLDKKEENQAKWIKNW